MTKESCNIINESTNSGCPRSEVPGKDGGHGRALKHGEVVHATGSIGRSIGLSSDDFQIKKDAPLNGKPSNLSRGNEKNKVTVASDEKMKCAVIDWLVSEVKSNEGGAISEPQNIQHMDPKKHENNVSYREESSLDEMEAKGIEINARNRVNFLKKLNGCCGADEVKSNAIEEKRVSFEKGKKIATLNQTLEVDGNPKTSIIERWGGEGKFANKGKAGKPVEKQIRTPKPSHDELSPMKQNHCTVPPGNGGSVNNPNRDNVLSGRDKMENSKAGKAHHTPLLPPWIQPICPFLASQTLVSPGEEGRQHDKRNFHTSQQNTDGNNANNLSNKSRIHCKKGIEPIKNPDHRKVVTNAAAVKTKPTEKSSSRPSVGKNIGNHPICSCSKSQCLKLYCTCFSQKVSCSKMCDCSNCKNKEGVVFGEGGNSRQSNPRMSDSTKVAPNKSGKTTNVAKKTPTNDAMEESKSSPPKKRRKTSRNNRNNEVAVPWLQHTPGVSETIGRCEWKHCPGKQSSAKRPRSRTSHMICNECSEFKGKNVYFCTSFKSEVGSIDCHLEFHRWKHEESIMEDAECRASDAVDGTDARTHKELRPANEMASSAQAPENSTKSPSNNNKAITHEEKRNEHPPKKPKTRRKISIHHHEHEDATIHWLQHKSIPCPKRGDCSWEECPGLNSNAARRRGFKVRRICQECTELTGKNIFFCMGFKSKHGIVNCHDEFHKRKHRNCSAFVQTKKASGKNQTEVEEQATVTRKPVNAPQNNDQSKSKHRALQLDHPSKEQPRQVSWIQRYQQLEKYKAENATCAVAPSESTGLYEWVARQRKDKKENILSKEKEILLTKLGFKW